MGFTIFAVFMVCLIGTSLVMGLVGVVFDAMRGSSAIPTRAVPEADLSLIRSDVLRPQSTVTHTLDLCR
jgi:hypothetical protein